MIKIRKSLSRGSADHGWLQSRHTFSFAGYFDPAVMGFRSLRVINEDVVAGGGGFPPHPHRDMEILSYVLDGALEHRDSAGNVATIRPGEVQRMSAGTGVTHSEFNPDPEKPAHFFQIWILPRATGLPFGYGQKSFAAELDSGRLVLAASPDGREGSVSLQQDAYLHVARRKDGQREELPLAPGRHAWVQVARGALLVNGQELNAGDGAAISEEEALRLAARGDTEFLVFDLA